MKSARYSQYSQNLLSKKVQEIILQEIKYCPKNWIKSTSKREIYIGYYQIWYFILSGDIVLPF